MQDELYMIIDYYPEVKDEPMICIIQLDQNKMEDAAERIQLPDYLNVEREITDQPEFTAMELARSAKVSSMNVLEVNGGNNDQ